MNAHDALKRSAAMSAMVIGKYTEDLSDAELLTRPAAGCNHLAWQLGHLISSECQLLDGVCPGAAPELPAGFAENHSKEAAASDDPSQFCTLAEYQQLQAKVREATAAAIDKLSAEDLDQPGPEHMRDFCPTVGDMLLLIASHPLMHAGQFVPVRRALGKPVVI
ncbi:DinB superfamily protein [Posidoniimonas polymericola]|uniref:DinB superfamily protein n=1 Tax=Posidoniimonas polymericola TaxID=2528002 RepID=A0A5C5YRR7_9BACT|nr:DinB family protein [Posidoniimonas polymericola]TWT77548.1 DinB superfamily protein [Posidoniimonas polymericola]